MVISYRSKNPAWRGRKRLTAARIPVWSKFLIAALLIQLNRLRLDLMVAGWDSWAIAALSAVALYLIYRGMRAGLWLAATLGVGFVLLSADLVSLDRIGPALLESHLLWAAGLLLSTVALLWRTRERVGDRDPDYERHARY